MEIFLYYRYNKCLLIARKDQIKIYQGLLSVKSGGVTKKLSYSCIKEIKDMDFDQ